MSNAALNRALREWNTEFAWMAKVLGVFWLFMLVFRAWIYWILLPHFPEFGNETLLAFWMGARFDLLVCGFLWIPPVVAGTLGARLKFSLPRPRTIWRIYFSVVWFLYGLLAGWDQLFFAAKFRHGTWTDLRQLDFSFMEDAIAHGGGGIIAGGVFVLIAMGLGMGYAWTSKARQVEDGPEESPGKLIWRLAGPILLVAMMARGTVTPHHLEKEHSYVSSSAILNKWVLNSLWAFNKYPDASL